jgi:hypothetical protein
MTRHAVPVILLLSTVLLPACGGSDEGSETFGVNLGNIAQARQNYIDSRSRLATAGIGIVKTQCGQADDARVVPPPNTGGSTVPPEVFVFFTTSVSDARRAAGLGLQSFQSADTFLTRHSDLRSCAGYGFDDLL